MSEYVNSAEIPSMRSQEEEEEEMEEEKEAVRRSAPLKASYRITDGNRTRSKYYLEIRDETEKGRKGKRETERRRGTEIT